MNQKMLGVNVDHIATLRQARGTRYPSPLDAALIAEKAGADLITVHLREDRRHIQDRDVFEIKDNIHCKLNFEMAATVEMLTIAKLLRPHSCCIVPERREELTTEGGLDIARHLDNIRHITAELKQTGIKVSLFIDPTHKSVELAQEVGADIVELHTGEYATAPGAKSNQLLDSIEKAAHLAWTLNLQVNAGHGLHYQNIQPLLAIEELSEFHIGHAIVSHACFVGFAEAVKEMKEIICDIRNRH